MSTPITYAMFAAIVVCLGIFVVGPQIVKDPDDFRGFYCAGRAVLHHADPYLAEPLRSCEYENTVAAGLAGYKALALPAPLPAFALIPFAAFALLPFTQASNLFTLMVLAAMVVTAVLTSRMTGFPIVGCIAAFVISDGTIDVLNGQLFPFALLALVASAISIQRDRPIAASVFASLAAIEPHVALPALLSLAWAVPKTRLPLAISLTVLGVLAVLTVGPAQNVEYLVRVLPAHAKSEVHGVMAQYSLTVLLVEAGVARDAAVAIANVQYAAMCVLGCVVARKLYAREGAGELLVLVPPAFAVFGGPFLHLTQVATAVPATIALAMRFPQHRTSFGIALLLLSASWQDLVENGMAAVVVAIVLITTAIAISLWPRDRTYAAIAVASAVALGIVERTIRISDRAVRGDPTHALALVAGPRELAEASWTAYITSSQFGDPRHHFASHVPTWIALIVMISTTCVLAIARSKRDEAPFAVRFSRDSR